MCERIVIQDARVDAAEAEQAEEEKKREMEEERKDRNPGMGIGGGPAAAQNDDLSDEEEVKRARGFPPRCETCLYECPSCGEITTFNKADVKRYQIVCK